MKQQENDFKYTNIINVGYWEKIIHTLDSNTLIKQSYTFQDNHNSISRSNIGGYQSNDNLHTFPEFYPLVNLLNQEVFNLTNVPNIKVGSMWLNISSHGHHNRIHCHSSDVLNRNLSGVLYLKYPPNSGDIILYNPMDVHFNIDITPKEKQLLIFPSRLLHSVNPNLSQEDRISIAFNYE
jgi:hypothetical protein